MKGYFARIANQSGLRFSSKLAVSPHRAREPHTGLPLEPLDREETLIVPSTVKSKSSETGALKRGTSSERPVSENTFPKPDWRKAAIVKSDSEQVLPPSVPEPTVSPVGGEPIVVTPAPENYRKKQVLASNKSPDSTASESMSAEIVQSVLVNPSARTEEHKKRSVNPSRAATASPETPEESLEKQHITRTAEVVEGHVAEPVQVQTILLREIQEWAAEGRATDKSDESVAFSSETIATKEFERITKPEVGGDRIAKKCPQASIPQMASQIDEQSFDLSIGTISVVIEGDERPPQPTPAPRADNRKNGYDLSRRRSRLSRNYL